MGIKDESTGIIPIFVNDNKENLFLVVLHRSGHWAFPKGHKKIDESDLVKMEVDRHFVII